MNAFEYHTVNGYIHHWLVTGPRMLEVTDLDRFYGYDFRVRIASHLASPDNEITQPPVEGATFTVDGQTLAFCYF